MARCELASANIRRVPPKVGYSQLSPLTVKWLDQHEVTRPWFWLRTLIAVPRGAKSWLETRTEGSDRGRRFDESNISASLLVGLARAEPGACSASAPG